MSKHKTKKNKPTSTLQADLPSVGQIRDFLKNFADDEAVTLKEVAKAFHVHRDDRKALRPLLKQAAGGRVLRRAKPLATEPVATPAPTHAPTPSHIMAATPSTPAMKSKSHLAPVMVLEITGQTDDGELIGVPHPQEHNNRVAPHILVLPNNKQGLAPAIGDRILAKIHRVNDHHYTASIMRVLPKTENTKTKAIGRIAIFKHGGQVSPINRKEKTGYFVHPEHLGDAKDGELVEVQVLPTKKSFGDKPAKVIACLGSMDAPRAFSLIAIHQHEIPDAFSDEAVAQAAAAQPPVPTGRTDLRSVPLITIDGADARDFDDAVYAEPLAGGGWKILVAIADVAHYVRPHDALDNTAYERGNSTYFPDRVVPMLPEALSNGLCSLNPNEDRYCLAVWLTLDADGNTTHSEFVRGIMRSHARRTYENAQEEMDGGAPSNIIKNLYGAYDALKRHIEDRGPLDLNLPEFKAVLNEDAKITDIYKVKRLDSHRLIEAYMIAANVAAADALSHANIPAMYRVHEAPDLAKITALKEMLKASGYRFAAGNRIVAAMFNGLLAQAEAKGENQAIHTAVLRSQMQASYRPKNQGHFGLSLKSYCHFTSPIRRYSDLLVHRALITLHRFHDHETDGIAPDALEKLDVIAQHISQTERRSMLAERDAMDRYVTTYMAQHVGATFDAHISSVTTAGFFVSLDDNGADGFIPKGAISDDFYIFDKKTMQLYGRRSKRSFRMGQKVKVRLDVADTMTGSLRFVPADIAPQPRKQHFSKIPRKHRS